MFLQINGTKIYIELHGCELNEKNQLSGFSPVLIAIPGGPGFSHTFLKPGLTPIANSYPVVYFDPRGTGKSDVCESSFWTIAQHAKDIATLCKLLAITKPVLYAHSAAAHYASAVALYCPDLLAGLILANGITVNKEAAFENLIELGGEVAEKVMVKLELESVPDYLEQVLPLYDPVPRPVEHAETLQVNIEQCLHMLHDIFDTPLIPQLHSHDVPTLCILGEMDPISPAHQASKLLEENTATHINWEHFAHSGHDNLLCEQEKTVDVVLNFMDTV